MAAKIIANLIIAGSTVLARAAVTAYRQALVNAQRSGVNAETVKQGVRSSKQLTTQEARQILGVDSGATWDQIMKKYEHLMAANEKHGSFYLQSKIYRARESLEEELGPPPNSGSSSDGSSSDAGGGGGQQQQQQQSPP